MSRQAKSEGGGAGDGNSSIAAISEQGRFVAFSTAADNLGGPAKPPFNVYVYDRKANKPILVSRRSRSQNGKGANGNSSRPSISASGRYVAFDSTATNLAGPAKNVANIYVYDTKLKRVELVSRKSNGGAGVNGDCDNARISADGRHVMFRTVGENLGGDATPDKGKIYVYDRETDEVELVSRKEGGAPANAGAETGEISADGRFAGFTTDATNLGGPAFAGYNSYVYDRKAGKPRLLSRRPASIGGGAANGNSFHPAPSADGRFSVFVTNATNLGGPIVMAPQQVYRYDLLGR